ncbi:hypothetical protein PGB90_007296 [Kerria lacca]
MNPISNLIRGVLILFLVIVFADDSNWWKNNILYEVFIRSFKDSDGDGIGDLNGIIREDFENLVHEMQDRGMKIIMDLVVNHCNDEHCWFQKSIDKIKPYDEYFIWKDAKNFSKSEEPIPPNNWISLFGGSAWEWNSKRKQFYLHQFGRKQPDFNLRNTNVKNEIKKILEFWINKGVHGFRFDAVVQFYEDEQFRDEPLRNPEKQNTNDIIWQDLIHIYTTDFWETYEFLHELRLFKEELQKKKGGIERLLKLDTPIVTADLINSIIMEWMTNMPQGATPSWNFESHDVPRMNSKTSNENSVIMLMDIMMLPGILYVYYGQEIGIPNGLLRFDQIKDKLGGVAKRKYITRDYERCPMQWDDTMSAGFTSNPNPYLPIDPSYWILNNLTRLRQIDTYKYGQLKTQIVSKWVYIITRILPGYPTYYVITNFRSEYEPIDLSDYTNHPSSIVTVETSSINSDYYHGCSNKYRFRAIIGTE